MSSNPCIRCGKERIDARSWKETVNNFMGKTVIVHTETVCPDPECQKIVEKGFEVQRKKREEMEHSKEERKIKFQELKKSMAKISLKSKTSRRIV